MAIPPSRLSDLLGACSSPLEMLSKLKKENLLVVNTSDADVLKLIERCMEKESVEINKQGFTWANASTMIAHELSLGYLTEKGMEWLARVG